MSAPTITPFPYLTPPGSYPPATIYLVLATPDFTPASAGPDIGSYLPIPYQPGTGAGQLVAVRWVLTNITFRMNVVSTNGPTTVIIESFAGGAITGAGAWTTTQQMNPAGATIAQGAYVQSAQPPVIANPYVNSGDLIRANYTALGTTAANFLLVCTFTMG